MNETDNYPYRYLIVDDDSFTCDIINRLLTKKGALHVDAAYDGKSAIAIMEAGDILPDIIICDLNMPGLDGIEFVHYLGQALFTGGLILMSGSDQIILNAVSKLGQSRFLSMLGTLSKPFAPAELITMLAQYTDIRRTDQG